MGDTPLSTTDSQQGQSVHLLPPSESILSLSLPSPPPPPPPPPDQWKTGICNSSGSLPDDTHEEKQLNHKLEA